jgi:hypothetical protein
VWRGCLALVVKVTGLKLSTATTSVITSIG